MCFNQDILFNIPHYEGHPQLWHLLLAIFAKNNFPYEITIKTINIIFSSSAMALLLFKSPFPKIVRCFLPFTYFLFYQYGINCRPYSLLMIALFLCAITYRNRNSKPCRHVLSLLLLCFTSAYGIILAGGLCLVWSFEIISELWKSKKLSVFYKDMRFYSLLFILISAIFIIYSIIPKNDTYYVTVDSNITILDKLKNFAYYEWMFIIPFESWSGVLIEQNAIDTDSVIMIVECILGLCLWIVLSMICAKNKKFAVFFIPYFTMTTFMVFKYMAVYHLGIGVAFQIFIFWIMCDSKEGLLIPDTFKTVASKITTPIIRKIVTAGCGVVCLSTIAFSIIASANEIKHDVGPSQCANFIKENHIEDKKIMLKWGYSEDENDKNEMTDLEIIMAQMEIPSKHRKIKSHSTYLCGLGSSLLPFFDENIFMNFNADCKEDMYMHYKYKEDYKKIMELWHEQGLPDFIINYCPILRLFIDKICIT